MGTLLYLVLVAVCTYLVYNIVKEYNLQICQSRSVSLMAILLIGFLLAGVISFILKFIMIPLLLIALLYFAVTICRH